MRNAMAEAMSQRQTNGTASGAASRAGRTDRALIAVMVRLAEASGPAAADIRAAELDKQRDWGRGHRDGRCA